MYVSGVGVGTLVSRSHKIVHTFSRSILSLLFLLLKQNGAWNLLTNSAKDGQIAIVEQLLLARADIELKDEVR